MGRSAEMSDVPRFVVVALVFVRDGESILLVKQNYGGRYWSLPGGKMEHGESIDQAAIREAREETGLEVRIKRVVGIYSKVGESELAVTLEGEIIGGSLQPVTAETSACRYWPLDHLPNPVRPHLVERIEDFRRDSPEAVLRSQ